MKKYPGAIIALAVATLALSACSAAAPTTAAPAGLAGGNVDADAILAQIGADTLDSEAICAGGKEYTIGYDTFSDTESFSVQQWKGLQKLSEDLGCVTVERLVDNADATQAVQNAKIFVQKEMDGAMLFNVIAAAAPGQARVLDEAGIPALTVGISAPGLPFLTIDEAAAGKQVGVALGQAYLDNGEPGDVYAVIARNDETGPVGIARMDGVNAGIESVLKDLPKDHILSVQAGDPATAQARTLDVLGKVPEGSTILFTGINDDIGYGVFRGIVQAGREDDALGVTIGAVRPIGLNYVCQNEQYVGGVAFQPEKFGNYMLPAIIAKINGAELPETIDIPSVYVSRDDIATVYPDFTCGEK